MGNLYRGMLSNNHSMACNSQLQGSLWEEWWNTFLAIKYNQLAWAITSATLSTLSVINGLRQWHKAKKQVLGWKTFLPLVVPFLIVGGWILGFYTQPEHSDPTSLRLLNDWFDLKKFWAMDGVRYGWVPLMPNSWIAILTPSLGQINLKNFAFLIGELFLLCGTE